MSTVLVPIRHVELSLESFAAASGLHPELVRRLVTLGALDPVRDANGDLWFPPSQLTAAARLQRLHAGLSLNYAALGLVCELLDRISVLEAALRRRPPPWQRPSRSGNEGESSWTRNG
jgi:chaperone modulatory protein CbpM